MKIRISDGMGHMSETVTLNGDTLHGSDWVVETLKRNGFEADDTMDAENVENEVWDAWTSNGYDGDPVENGLTITVTE